MTREDLTIMTGSEEQTDFAIKYILGSIKPEFVRAVVRARLGEIQTRINELSNLGEVAVYRNGTWGASYGSVASGEATEDEYYEVGALLYEKNRLTSIIAVR